MIIPWQELEKETLINIVESFILREGTDYGMEELSLAEKTENLLSQIRSGNVTIFWSELHQTIDIKANNA
ncbi:YheU family protein [Mannheimia massilioguelmaensis]|uniref:YheU family protein n=1 Tax=Mannheimia massilioguelmaensis TaxID=1604354 RepID=UPI0005C94D61|nr:YheU family protein [Mannheimia massilioguelmaensis]